MSRAGPRGHALCARTAGRVPDLAWLAADRAMTVASAAGDPLPAATAAVPLGQTLRAVGQGRLLVDADGIASAEVRLRPSARTVVAEVALCARPAAGVAGRLRRSG